MTTPEPTVDDRVRFEAGRPFQQWCELWTAECLRVLRPGGHLLAFGGTRTWHRLACAVEDAGFEIRDSIAWMYGSGFPKSLDVSKAIDKAAGAEREVVVNPRAAQQTASAGGGADEGATRSEVLALLQLVRPDEASDIGCCVHCNHGPGYTHTTGCDEGCPT